MKAPRDWSSLKKVLSEEFHQTSFLDDEGTAWLLLRHLRGEELGDPADKAARMMVTRLVLAYSDISAACQGNRLRGLGAWQIYNGTQAERETLRQELAWTPEAEPVAV